MGLDIRVPFIGFRVSVLVLDIRVPLRVSVRPHFPFCLDPPRRTKPGLAVGDGFRAPNKHISKN